MQSVLTAINLSAMPAYLPLVMRDAQLCASDQSLPDLVPLPQAVVLALHNDRHFSQPHMYADTSCTNPDTLPQLHHEPHRLPRLLA